jgi:hypothetical protein
LKGEYTHFGVYYAKNIEVKQVDDLFWLISAESVEFKDTIFKIKSELILNNFPTTFSDKKTIDVSKHKIEPTILILEKITSQVKTTNNKVNYDNINCVTVEIITPYILVTTRYEVIMEITEKYPEYLTVKGSDLHDNCWNLVENGQEIHVNDLIDLYYLAYSIKQQANHYDEVAESDEEE